jgi:putative membrane protein
VKQPLIGRTWKAVSSPFSAWIIHGISVWLWHIPFLYQATLDNELVHATQHITFLGTALLFWWTLLHGRGERMTYGAAVVYVFTTAVHTSVLGALLTCTSKLWYPAYIGHTAAWGLSALEDQMAAGIRSKAALHAGKRPHKGAITRGRHRCINSGQLCH